MNKIVLDFKEQKKLENEDIIVYNEREKCWSNMKKEVYLGDLSTQIKSVNNRIDNALLEINKLRNEIKEIAKITLEDLKK